MQNWETLIADKIAMHRDSYRPQRIEDPGKRNQANAQKRWAEKNPERRREIQRKHDAKRRNDPKRKAWQKEYDASPNASSITKSIAKKTRTKSTQGIANTTQPRRERRQTASITHSGAKRTRNMTENVSASGGEKLIQIQGP